VRTAWAGAGECACLFLLWLLFTTKASLEECLAGAAAAFVGTVGWEAAQRAQPLCFRPPFRALAQIVYTPWLILQDTWILALELVRKARGKPSRSLFELTRFAADGTDCRSAAKRALVIAYTTLSPNLLILGVDRKTRLMLFHQVRKDPVPQIVGEIESA
jgi:multisubunit Na+/H+ antiporter MnhE subunit